MAKHQTQRRRVSGRERGRGGCAGCACGGVGCGPGRLGAQLSLFSRPLHDGKGRRHARDSGAERHSLAQLRGNIGQRGVGKTGVVIFQTDCIGQGPIHCTARHGLRSVSVCVCVYVCMCVCRGSLHCRDRRSMLPACQGPRAQPLRRQLTDKRLPARAHWSCTWSVWIWAARTRVLLL